MTSLVLRGPTRRTLLCIAAGLATAGLVGTTAVHTPEAKVALNASEPDATVPNAGTSASTTTTMDVAPTTSIPPVRTPVVSAPVPPISVVKRPGPAGWVAFEEPEALVAVRADASRRVVVSLEGEDVLGAAWSPVANELAYLTNNSPWLRVVNVDTGRARSIDVGGSSYDSMFSLPTWSPTGAHIAVNTIKGLALVTTLTGEVRQSGDALAGAVSAWDHGMEFSPNGLLLAGHTFGCTSRRCEDPNLTIVSVITGERRTIATSGYYPRSPRWSRDGLRLAFKTGKELRDTTTSIIGVDGKNERVILAGASPLQWDPLQDDGLFLLREPTGVRYADVGRGTVKSIGPEGPSMPGFLSPDGTTVAYGQSCDGVYAGCLYTVDRSGDNERLVAKSNWTPATGWTADSTAVLVRQPVTEKWGRVVVYDVGGERSWVLSDHVAFDVLAPDTYLYASRVG